MSNGTNLSIDIDQSEYLRAKIKVIGVGGGGCNAIENMVNGNFQGVELIAANTDSQALNSNKAKTKLQLGLRTTKGLGAGSDPEVGRKAAEESEQDLIDALKDADMVFVTCGMGGGTGTGASPIVARIAKEQGALVVGIVTKPFDYEGKVRLKNAQNGIDELMKNVDAIIVIPNQKIYAMIEEDTDIDDAMLEIDQILFNSTKGISDIINRAGKFNVDFADVRTIMKDKGQALMGIGRGEGKNRALEAATNAITSPLLEGISIKGAKGLLLNITGGKTISQVEIKTVINTIKDITGDDINLIYGVVKTGEETDVLSVTVIATGFDSTPEPQNQTPVIKPNHHPNPIFEIPPTPRVYSRQGTFFPNDVKTVNEEIPVSRVAQSFKPLNGGFETNPNNGTSSRNDSQIPKGHVLKEYDKPAIIRNTANVPNDYPAYQDSIGTTFETEQDVVEVTPELEEIQLDNYQQGYDIMSAPTSLERNNFSKYSY